MQVTPPCRCSRGAAHDLFGSHAPGRVALAARYVLGGVCARRAAARGA
jgi:hypothetical protein